MREEIFQCGGTKFGYSVIGKKVVFITAICKVDENSVGLVRQKFGELFSHWNRTVIFANGHPGTKEFVEKEFENCPPADESDTQRMIAACEKSGIEISPAMTVVVLKSHKAIN